jgi:hypothetical protein
MWSGAGSRGPARRRRRASRPVSLEMGARDDGSGSLVVAAYVFADEYRVPARQGRPALTSDADLVALAVAQAAIRISSDRQFLGLARSSVRVVRSSPVGLRVRRTWHLWPVVVHAQHSVVRVENRLRVVGEAVGGGPSSGRGNGSTKPRSGSRSAGIAPRRSPVRVRLAPSAESPANTGLSASQW